MKKTSRTVAFAILLQIEKNQEYSNIGIDKALSDFDADSRERAFAARLVNGVCERKITLDYNIRRRLFSPKSRIKPNVRTLLRMGAYELLFCDGVPARASVNEYVNLAKQSGAGYASGMINAVLRGIAQDGLLLPDEGSAEYDSVKYSFPAETIAFFRQLYGGTADAFFVACLQKPKIYGRWNGLKTDFQTLSDSLAQDGVPIERCCVLPEAFYFTGSAGFMQTQAFRRGWFHIQDLSSQLCCEALQVHPGQSVLDVCAAPGGKTFTLAQKMQNTGTVVSCDIYPHKIELIRSGAERLGLMNVRPVLRDAAAEHKENAYDRVLCDVPCSGFGVVRKKSEIRYRPLTVGEDLTVLQRTILENAASLVKPGGRLVYSTCTVTESENEEQIRDFLSRHPDFFVDSSVRFPVGTNSRYGVRFSCHQDDCDGFFFSPLCRKG